MADPLHLRRVFSLLILGGIALLGLTACQSAGGRYFANRYYDFRDVFSLGGSVTTAHSVVGSLPPMLGVYTEATDLLHLGFITNNGLTAELDGRGSGVYPESRWRMGFLFWQALHVEQQYDNGAGNYFKTPGTRWALRLAKPPYVAGKVPAKDLTYQRWGENMKYGVLLRHRGYEHWGNCNFEAAISDPLLTHFGLGARAGFDAPELFDFLLGWVGLDYEHDDLTADEAAEMTAMLTGAAALPALDGPASLGVE